MSLQQAWYRSSLAPSLLFLLPLQLLFVAISTLRKWLYKIGLLKAYRAPVPVLVVGNISVGGTGKTPVTQALVAWLAEQGYRPAIISRGYGGQGPFPRLVTAQSEPRQVGDEPRLLAQRTAVPVVVSPNRQQAIELLLAAHPEVDLIISDDGLQHYALARDFELVVIDGNRGHGNGWRLPMGPLREPVSRLKQVDMVVQNGGQAGEFGWRFELKPGTWRRVQDHSEVSLPPAAYTAIAGIGHPQRFFATLEALGITAPNRIAFADHHAYDAAELKNIEQGAGLLMTEKDAAKCHSFAQSNWYYLPVTAAFETGFWHEFKTRIKALYNQTTEAR